MEPTATTESALTSRSTEDERRRHNDRLPIHHFPPELLCKVFKDTHKKGNYRRLFAIRSVCKYWMEIVDSSPELWTFVSLMHDENLLDMILQKSKNRLLSVEYNNLGWPHRPPVPIRKTTNFANRVIPLANRWEWFCCRAHNHDIAWALHLRLQNLETLQVHAPEYSTHYPHPLHAPKLQHVALGGLSLDWRSPTDLRSVILTSPAGDPPVDQVYVLFINCPRLEVFHAQGQAYSPWPQGNSNVNLPSAPAFLPYLRNLVLAEVPVAPYSRLLSRINAPNLQRLFFSRQFKTYEHNRTPMFEPVERFLGTDVHSLNTDRLRINGSRYSFNVSVGACDFVYNSINGWTWQGHGYDLLSEVAAAFSGFDAHVRDSIKVIHFAGTRSREDLKILGPILQSHFPNVEELSVTLSSSTGRPDADLVLGALTSPLPLEGRARWLFPGLITLHLKACRESVCDGVLSVIEARRNGAVRAIQRVSTKNGRIRRDIAAQLKATLQEFCMAGTRYIETESEVA